jgi:hypothetical protein
LTGQAPQQQEGNGNVGNTLGGLFGGLLQKKGVSLNRNGAAGGQGDPSQLIGGLLGGPNPQGADPNQVDEMAPPEFMSEQEVDNAEDFLTINDEEAPLESAIESAYPLPDEESAEEFLLPTPEYDEETSASFEDEDFESSEDLEVTESLLNDTSSDPFLNGTSRDTHSNASSTNSSSFFSRFGLLGQWRVGSSREESSIWGSLKNASIGFVAGGALTAVVAFVVQRRKAAQNKAEGAYLNI